MDSARFDWIQSDVAARSRKTYFADVAALAGVSIPTVDRVVNARGGVKVETEEKVLAAARELQLDRRLNLRPTKILRLGVILHNDVNPYLRDLRNSFRRAILKYMELNVQLLHYNYLEFTDHALIATVMKAKGECDGLVLDAFRSRTADDQLRKISDTTPLITLTSDLPHSGRIAFVGSDGIQEGRTAGELIGRFLGAEGGDILIIKGHNRFTLHEQNEIGFRLKICSAFPACRIVEVFESKESERRIFATVKRVLSEFPMLKGIYNDSVGNREIVEALEKSNRTDVKIIANSLTEENTRLLKRGKIDAILNRDTDDDATTAVEYFLKVAGRLDDAYEPQVKQPRIYLRENLPSNTS